MRLSLLLHGKHRSVALTATVALAAAGVAIVAAPVARADGFTGVTACDATTCTTTFGFTGYAENFTVPAGVTSVRATVNGAPGGYENTAAVGSTGGVSRGTIAVSSGDTLTVRVGQAGATGGTERTYGGGGPVPSGSRSGSGGGRSSVSTATDDLLLVAGGGGGNSLYRSGGAGGGAQGDDGSSFPSDFAQYTNAGGGTQTMGGAAGRAACCRPSFGGQYPSGGAGDSPGEGDGGYGADLGDPAYQGGGGGGGYHGGGGGSLYESGAGGSGYIAPSLTDTVTETGGSSAGSIAISWQKASTSTSLTASPGSGAAGEGDSVTLTATVSSATGTPTGTVFFTADETGVTGCTTVPVGPDGVATCDTTFAGGEHRLDASYSGSPTYASSVGYLNDYEVASAPKISTEATLPAGTVGVGYSQTLTATGGDATGYDYSFAGAHPAWLSLSAAGELTGTPTAAAPANTFTVKIDDGSRSSTKDFSITVGQGSQEISFEFAPESPVVGGTYDVTTSSKGAGSEDLVFSGNDKCSVSGTTVSFLHVGTCTVTATQDGDDNYSAAQSVSHDAEVEPGGQTLTVTSNPPAKAMVKGSHALTVSGGPSSAPVVVAVDADTENEACTIDQVTDSVVDGQQQAATTINFDKVGSCVVRVTQDGDDDHNSATDALVTIEVTGKPTATTVSVTPTTVVHGQSVRATATVTGDDEGLVFFYVDDHLWDVQDLDGNSSGDGGTATSRNLAAAFQPTLRGSVTPLGLPRPSHLDVGAHDVTAAFRPDDTDTYARSEESAAAPLTVTPAKSTTTLKVTPSALVAAVSVNVPSADLPTGKVSFLVAGKVVETVDLIDGVARLEHKLAAGSEDSVAAVYYGRKDGNGNNEITGSSTSTARKNPTVTATVSSSQARNRAGWYSRPVTVRFSCTAGSAAVSCPKPVTVTREGVSTISRTALAEDGGVATVSVTVKLDRKRPTVKIAGVSAGRTYATLPATACSASDVTSGIASCRVTRKARGKMVTYRATAVDVAGNVSRTSVSVRRTPVLVSGAAYSGAVPTVHRDQSYTIVYTGKGRPHYLNTAPAPAAPKGDGGAFRKIGKNRWAFSVVFTSSKGHSMWNFGVKLGKKTIVVKVHVVK